MFGPEGTAEAEVGSVNHAPSSITRSAPVAAGPTESPKGSAGFVAACPTSDAPAAVLLSIPIVTQESASIEGNTAKNAGLIPEGLIPPRGSLKKVVEEDTFNG